MVYKFNLANSGKGEMSITDEETSDIYEWRGKNGKSRSDDVKRAYFLNHLPECGTSGCSVL